MGLTIIRQLLQLLHDACQRRQDDRHPFLQLRIGEHARRASSSIRNLQQRCLQLQIQLGNKTLSGTRINITLVGQLLSLEFFEIQLNDYKTRFIAFQDSKDEEGNNSKELADTIKMVHETITFLEN